MLSDKKAQILAHNLTEFMKVPVYACTILKLPEYSDRYMFNTFSNQRYVAVTHGNRITRVYPRLD